MMNRYHATRRCRLAGMLATLALAWAASTAAATEIFQVNSFASPVWSLPYFDGFTGTVGTTATWPAEMGWQGDRIDLAFDLPADIPAAAQSYHFRMVIAYRYTQAFTMNILAGPSQADLVQVHSEYVDSPRVLIAEIPLERFTPGQTNWIRIQGVGVQVGEGQASGVQWKRWRLSRVDVSDSIDTVRWGQLQRLTWCIQNSIMSNGMVLDAMTFSPSVPPFHPATPDAAGFALLGLCAADHLGLATNAEEKVEDILSVYAGHTPGVTPDRQPDGHWVHFMNPTTGAYAPGWDGTYSTIGSALLVSGALFAKNHFIENATIGALADELYATTNFDAAIHPSLDGRVYLGMSPSGGAAPGELAPWNEYMLVVSCALREPNSVRAQVMGYRWLDPAYTPKRSYRGLQTLTDNPGGYAPAFWVHQQHFFNTDFASNAQFETLMLNHQRADAVYCADELGLPYRYGLTAGEDPTGYYADRIYDHHNVLAPEAVGGWGDIPTLMELIEDNPPYSDPRFRYGLPRESTTDPNWFPTAGGHVDHLFLMLGLVETIDPLFFKQRQAFQSDVDGDGLADAYDNCPYTWNRRQSDANADGIGDACDCGTPFGDADHDNDVDLLDYALIQTCPATAAATPEACYCFDRNADRQITGSDIGDFLDCIGAGGPDVTPDPNCGN